MYISRMQVKSKTEQKANLGPTYRKTERKTDRQTDRQSDV